MKAQIILHSADLSGEFALSDSSGACAVVATAHGMLCSESRDWLRGFLLEHLEQSVRREEAQADAGGESKGVLVDFFQAVHAGLFRERQRFGGDIGEVSVAAAWTKGELVQVGSAGRCAVYLLLGSEARRVLPADEPDADQAGLGTELKVSMDMVRRTFAEDCVYLLSTRRIDVADDWPARLVEAVRAVRASAADAADILFGKEGGALVVLEGPAAERAVAETCDVGWYQKLRQEIGRTMRGDRRQVPVESSEEAEPVLETGTVEEDEGDAKEVTGKTEEPFVREDEQAKEQADSVPKQPQLSSGGTADARVDAEVGLGASERLQSRRSATIPAKVVGYLIVAVAALVAIYALWSGPGRRWGSRPGESESGVAAVGSALVLSSLPAGAEVIVDDRVTGSRTPVSSLPLAPGTHEVKVRLGEFGEWAGTVSLAQGETANLDISFTGGISVSSPPKEGLSVFLDGRLKGATPCLLDSVPAGLHVVKVEGEGFSTWQEEVVVTYGGVSEVLVRPGKLPETGLVRVTSRVLGEEGYEESRGLPVAIDGKRVGSTPYRADLKPGLHSIKVGGSNGRAPSVQIVEVRPGGKHYIRAELGGTEPILIECSEVKAPGRTELVVYASLTGQQEPRLSDVSLYLEKAGGKQVRWQPMVMLPGSQRVYASAVPEVILSAEGALKYYVRARTPDGIEYYSEVRTLSGR